MNYESWLYPLLGSTLAIPAIVIPILTSTDPGFQDGQYIQVVFYNKENSSVEIFGKVKINIDHIKYSTVDKKLEDDMNVIKKHKYCVVENSTSSSSTKDCSTFTQVDSSKPESVFLAKLAHQYIVVQHFTNLLNAKQASDTNVVTTGSGTCSGCVGCCDPTKCSGSTAAGTNNCCCCAICCSTDITATTNKNDFNTPIQNLSSSYESLYFMPTNSYIFLGDLKLTDIQTTRDSTTEVEKVMYGSLLYSFVDYYYKTTNVTDEWVKQYIGTTQGQNATAVSSSTSSKSGHETKYFINYPLKLKYKIKSTNTATTTPSVACTATTCELQEIYKKWNTAEVRKTSLENNTDDMKNLINCNKIGQIEKNKIDNIKNIFQNTCVCKP